MFSGSWCAFPDDNTSAHTTICAHTKCFIHHRDVPQNHCFLTRSSVDRRKSVVMSAWPWNLLILPHTPSPRSRWSNRRKENPTKGLVVTSWEMKKRLGTISQEVECALTRQPASMSNSHRQKSWAQESRDGNGSSSSHHYTQYPTHRISDFKPITWVLLVRRT